MLIKKNHSIFFQKFHFKIPICVDLDGTLIKEDVTITSLKELFKKSSCTFIKNITKIQKGRNILKEYTSKNITNIVDKININLNFIKILNKVKKNKRKIILSTAANKTYGNKIKNYLPIFDQIIGSNKHINIREKNKSKVLTTKFKNNGFIYAGNSIDDIKIWIKSQGAICVNTPKIIIKKLSKLNLPYLIIQ